MATRRERVLLELEDHFTSEMLRAAAATKTLDKSLGSLSGSAVQSDRQISKTQKSIKGIGDSSDRSGKQIDKLSGRLALLAQAAAVLGPALIPLGAPLVGVMAGLTAQLGAVAGAVGVSILAFKGLGDGMKALNDFQLEPTAANFTKLQAEMKKLGPAGREFVLFLDDLDPQLRSLQRASRNGLLPGVQEGITKLLPLLPQVRRIVREVAEAMGGLASGAGADLAGPEWASFFNYLDNEAGPILTEFGQTVGNFAQGFAGLLVGLAPLTDDFSGGLLGMSEAFAAWSAGLAGNNSFQEFIRYVQDSGPDAVAMLGELASTFGQILVAAAPVGSAILPVLTKMLDVIGDLAASPLGTLFFTAAAGLSVYSRAASLADKATTRLAASQTKASGAARSYAAMESIAKNAPTVATGIGMIALASTDLDEKAGLSNTAMLTLAGSMAGPWGTAAGAAVGVTMDVAAANDNLAASVKNAYAALESGDISATTAKLAQLRADIQETDEVLGGSGFFSMGKAKQVFTGLNEVFSGENAKAKDAAKEVEEGLRDLEMQAARVKSNAAGGIIPKSARDDMFNAARAAEDLAASLASVNRLLDRRGSWVSYEAAVDAATQSIKDNGRTLNINTEAGRANRTALDDIAATANKLAENMKGTNRVRVLAAARKDFVDTAVKMGMLPKAAQALADKLGLLARVKAEPKVTVNTTQARAQIDGLRAYMRLIDGSTATTYINTVRRGAAADAAGSGRGPQKRAEGGYIRGPGTTTSDSIPALLSDREYVIKASAVDHYGVDFMHRINAKRFASGGQALLTPDGIAPSFGPLTGSLRELQRELKRSEKAVKRETDQRDALVSKRNDVRSGISEGLGGDIWAAPENIWAPGATANPTDMLRQQTAQAKEFTTLIKKLKRAGLDGAALAEVIGSGDIERARMMAALPASALRQFERAYNLNQQALQSAGVAGGQAAYGAQVAESNRELRGLRGDVRRLEAAIKHKGKSDNDSRSKNAKKISDSQRRGAAQGFRSRANG